MNRRIQLTAWPASGAENLNASLCACHKSGALTGSVLVGMWSHGVREGAPARFVCSTWPSHAQSLPAAASLTKNPDTFAAHRPPSAEGRPPYLTPSASNRRRRTALRSVR